MKRLRSFIVFALLALLLATVTVYGEGRAPLAELSVSVDSYVYGSERSEPTVTGNTGGGEVSYYLRRHTDEGSEKWNEITARPVRDGMPTVGGRYELKITVAPTESYDGGSAVCGFYVHPTDLDVRLSVKDSVYFGDGCGEGELFSIADLLGREYAVEYSVRGEDSFSPLPPSRVGLYTLRISVKASPSFNATVKYADFEIKKRPVASELKLEDATVSFDKTEGLSFSPVYLGNSEAVREALAEASVTVSYRPLGSSENFSETVPCKVGEYEVRVKIAESESLTSASLGAVLRLTKAEISPSVTVKGWKYGEEPVAPTLSEGSNPGVAKVTYYYKPEGGEFTERIPVDAGRYTVKAVIGESESYGGGECYALFTVERADIKLSVFMDGWEYGECGELGISGNEGGGECIVTYYYRTDDGLFPVPTDELVSGKPSRSGEYRVVCEVLESRNYNRSTAFCDFTVSKATPDISVEMEDYPFYGRIPSPAVKGNAENGRVSFIYTKKGDDLSKGREDISSVATLPGEYTVTVIVSETENYRSAVLSVDFTVEKADLPVSSMGVTLKANGEEASKVDFGTPFELVLRNNVGYGSVDYFYKSEKDTEYNAEKPTAVGRYTVKVSVAATDIYKPLEIYFEFEIVRIGRVGLALEYGDSVYGEGHPLPRVTGDLEELTEGNWICEYKPYGADDGEYSTDVPTDAGRYTVRLTVPMTESYLSCALTDDFTVKRARGRIEGLSDTDVEWSGKAADKPYFKVVGDGEVRVEYYLDGVKLTNVPTASGEYTVRVILADGMNYSGCEAEATLRIIKADLPTQGDVSRDGSLWVYILMAVLTLLLAVALVVFIVLLRMAKKESPVGLLVGGYALPTPPSPESKGTPTDGTPTDGVESQNDKAAEAVLTDRGMIALNMWRMLCGGEDKHQPEVVYRKGGRCAEINIDTLCRHFEDGDRVDRQALIDKGLVNRDCKRVKLLGRGELTKKLEISLDSYSKRALEIIRSNK